MKIQDAIALIDTKQEPANRYSSPVTEAEIEQFAEMFDLYCGWSTQFSSIMRKHWLSSWVCTDTRVGLAVYCIGDEPVAISIQHARKADEIIKFLSADALEKTRLLVISCIEPDDYSKNIIADDYEIPDEWFNISDKKYMYPFVVDLKKDVI